VPRARANGIELEYEVSGPQDGPPLLLIQGLGAQLIRWPPALCDGLAAAGYRVVRYDHRDIGLSTRLDDAPLPDLEAAMAARLRGEEPDIPYAVSDLAADAAGLLDALDIARAHVFGVSLGGQVAQALATGRPARVRSLALMMTHTSNPALPTPNSPALAILTTPAPNPAEDEEAFVANSLKVARAIGSPDYPIPEAELRAFALAQARRAYYPAGVARQLAAGRTAPDVREALRRLDVPTVVIHGAQDPLVPVACAEDIASNIRRAMILVIRGMGHDLPPQLCDAFASAIAANARRAD
jgi:pimeloyl-ACP methyl ester carboxylesterase